MSASLAELKKKVALLTRERDEARDQQRATADVLRVIAASPTDIGPVLKSVVESAARLCGAHDASILLKENDSLAVAVHFGPISVDFTRFRLTRDWVAGRSVVDARTIHVPDLLSAGDDFAAGRAMAERLGHRTILGTPMLRDGEAIGTILLRRTEVAPFTDKQIELVETFADQAVIAIENVRLFEEVHARNRALTESLEQQTATNDVLSVIASSPTDLQSVFDMIAERSAHLCDARFSNVCRFDGELIHFVAHHGISDIGHHALDSIYPMPPGRAGATSRAIMNCKVEQIADVLEDPDYALTGLANIIDFRAVAAVPMLKNNRAIGAIAVAALEPGLFPARQIALLQTFADQAVIAIENVRLFDEVRARTRDLGEALEQQTATSDVLKAISRSAFDLHPVLQTLVDSAVRLSGADMGAITLREGDTLRFMAGTGQAAELHAYERAHPHPLGRGTFQGRAALEGATIHVPDVLKDAEYERPEAAIMGNFRAVLSVPLKRDQEIIGVFGMARRTAGPFAKRQIELVETFADQAVIAIENARLFEEVQARNREISEALEQQTATGAILRVIAASPTDIQPVLRVVAESAARFCDTHDSIIFLEQDGFLVPKAHHGPIPFDLPSMPVTRDWVTGRAVADRETLHIHDLWAAGEEFPISRSLGERFGHHTIVATPMMQDNKAIGALVIRRIDVRPFSDKQIGRLKTFADQAVIAIENVRLFEEVRARNREISEALEQQTATGAILRVIAASPTDIQPVLQVVAESAARFCDTHDAVIFLAEEGDLVVKAHYGPVPLDFASLPIGDGTLAGRAYAERKTQYVDDLLNGGDEFPQSKAMALRHGHRSIAATPLMRDEEAIGVIVIRRFEVKSFSEKQIELLRTFADQAVIAIQNVRLFDEVRAKTRDLEKSLNDLRTAQDRLIQTEKLASLGQLTAGIAHEIKNPLNFVNNFAALSGDLLAELSEALDRAAQDSSARGEIDELVQLLNSNLDKVVEHGKRADSIVKNMLLHSREGSGEHLPTVINSLVEESLNLAYHGARAERKDFNITLEKSFDPEAGEVDLYPQEITRVLLNLISNGLYATAMRRQNTNGPYEPILAAVTKDLGDHVEIRIRDNGTGISPGVRERMFNPFFTTKPVGEGTGLGLSLSHDIVVKQHAGTIEVETEPGAFTEFRILLPRGAATLAKAGDKV